MGLLVSVALSLGYLYSGPPCYLKRGAFTGAMTGICGGLLTYMAGDTAGGGMVFTSRLAYFAVTMSLWMGLVGSLTKDLSDLAGDAAAGRRTAALMVGETKARLAASVAATSVATAFLVTAISFDRMLILSAITLGCGAVALTIICLPKFSLGNFSFRRRPYRAFMVTQYAAHISLIAVVAYSLLRQPSFAG
jgi:4-hydroxybenzoate polyprenyltransferase